MVGAICKRDILAHPFVTIHCFGWPVFFRALVAGRNRTFLSLLTEPRLVLPAVTEVPALVGKCVELELRAKRIYQALARRFDQQEPVRRLFESLARQENGHAELLQLCRAAAQQGRWRAEHFDPWRRAVPRLEQQMREAESRLDSVTCSADAMQLAIQIESSEINHVFLGIIAASESGFVKKLKAFQRATSNHISFICREIPKLAPDLASTCRQMLDQHAKEEDQ